MNLKPMLISGAALVLGTIQPGLSAEVPKAPVPVSPFIRVVYGFADTLLKNGRDTHGPQKTGLFLSALDRQTLAPLTNRPAAAEGVRAVDRAGSENGLLVGANPFHDQNLLRLLSTLTELSAKPQYRAAADAELKWLLENARPLTSDAAWDGRISWDVMRDQWTSAPGVDRQTPRAIRPWLLWDRCFTLAPEASRQLARLAANPTASPREAGFCIRGLAAAYEHTRDEQFVREGNDLISRYETRRGANPGFTGLWSGQTNAGLSALLSLAIDCDGAASRMPEPLASRLRALAERGDDLFCSSQDGVRENGGFLLSTAESGDPATKRRTPLWSAAAGGNTAAQLGMMCVSRYDNSGQLRYRDLVLAAADLYLDSLPVDGEDAWPGTFGHAISLEIAAWRHSSNPVYMDRARSLGTLAVEKFWGTNALPRASLKTDHYEAITGADTLVLALLELHLQILHITAVRCPANTMDR